MEYLEKIMKKTGWVSLVSSIVFAILGIVLINKPSETLTFVSYVFGIMFILIGIYKIVNYFVNKEQYNLYNYDMAFGIIAILFGLVTIGYCNQIGNIFRILIGLWITYSSIIRINLAIKLKYMESNTWVYSLIIALIMFACGIYVIFNSGVIMVTMGIIILVYSILDIIENTIFLININKTKTTMKNI